MRTENWQSNTRGLRLVGEVKNGFASTTFGPVKAGLTTTHRTQDQVLSELLNSLEREVESLHSKYCEAYVTLTSALDLLVRLGDIIKKSDVTDTL